MGWTKTHPMSRTTTPRTQRTVATATMTKTRIKRRHPRLVHAAALSLRRRERKNDRLLARKRSPDLRPESDPGRSQRRKKARAQNLERGKKADRDQSLEKERK